ncbi:MAG: LLM class F420-dependent oxidoreductase [Chloroflexaceae bacterium]|jgi:probable F420-dependent oxidoreductase|nr:LLM class F420-dependent oxidoreductase [Chloroflexaceae bacterium]
MQVGIIIPNAGPKCSPQHIVTVARWAEELGYHSLWVTDHVALPVQCESHYPYRSHGRWDYPPETPWLDPLLALSWAGAAASRLKLGTSVLVGPLRHPVLLAKQLATLDYLSGGRMMLGLGAGWMAEEFATMNVSFENRGRRLDEMVALMRACWSGEAVEFQGQFYQASGFKMHPRPAQERIPIIWGGHSAASLRRVARLGDGWHPTQIPLEQLATGIGTLRQLWQEAERDPASLLVVARPGNTYAITPESHARHRELGVTHLVADTPIPEADPDLALLRQRMEEVASICGLTSSTS